MPCSNFDNGIPGFYYEDKWMSKTMIHILTMRQLWIALERSGVTKISTNENVTFIYAVNFIIIKYVDGLVQDCGISSANALEIPQSCTKPLILYSEIWVWGHFSKGWPEDFTSPSCVMTGAEKVDGSWALYGHYMGQFLETLSTHWLLTNKKVTEVCVAILYH